MVSRGQFTSHEAGKFNDTMRAGGSEIQCLIKHSQDLRASPKETTSRSPSMGGRLLDVKAFLNQLFLTSTYSFYVSPGFPVTNHPHPRLREERKVLKRGEKNKKQRGSIKSLDFLFFFLASSLVRCSA